MLLFKAKLRGNLMALKPSEVVAEPMLIVCEKTQVEKVDGKHAFLLKTGISETVVSLETEEELDKWLVKSLSSPNRIVICEEVMYESKLSSILPLEFVKMCKQWHVRLRDDIRDKLYGVRNASMQEAAHNAMRHLNSNIENYVQAVEFLEAYEGPSFRPSREKYRIAFAPVPTNLHVQYFHVAGGSSAYWITSGAVSAMPLRFANGGLSRIRHTLQASLDPNGVDHTLETRFHNRQQVLQNAKRCIGELTRRIDNEWHLTAFGTPDNVGLRILADVKQVHETVIDLINSFPNIGNIVDSLCPDGLAGFRNSPVKDTLSNQTDCIEACMTSLNSKMAVLDKVDDNEKGRQFFVDCAKSALNSTLDSLLQLVDSLMLAQLLGLVLALRKQSDSQLFFHLQQRQDFVLSQAVTVVCTALLASIERLSAESLTAWDS
ncbi:inositol polyphosphate-4-phosphatase, partial [Aphelenchoides avenae]